MQKDPSNLFEISIEKRFFELELIKGAELKNFYSETIKTDSKIYFFGGMGAKGDIIDDISCYDISNEKMIELNLKLPIKMYSFTISHDEIDRDLMYIVGGLKENLIYNEKIFSLRFKNDKGKFNFI